MNLTETWPLCVRASEGSIRPIVVVKLMSVPFCTGVPRARLRGVGAVPVPPRRLAVLDDGRDDGDFAVQRTVVGTGEQA